MKDLFGDDTVANIITPDTRKRADTVIKHWQEMVSKGERRVEGHWNGEILNPLANREHDALWEHGDGEAVSHLVAQKIKSNPEVAKLAIHPDVKRYVSHRLLDLANTSLSVEESVIAGSAAPASPELISYSLRYLKENMDASDKISEHYDNDPIFADAINAIIPNFEYPDWSHRTIGQAIHSVRPKMDQPAILTGAQAAMVEDGKIYVGSVVSNNGAVLVHDLGRKTLVAHQLDKLNRVPAPGSTVRIEYSGGRGEVSEAKMLRQGNER